MILSWQLQARGTFAFLFRIPLLIRFAKNDQ